MRYVGAVAATPPPSGDLESFELVSTANGGGTHQNVHPKAIYDSVSDKTFFTYIGSDAIGYVAELNNATGVVTRTAVATLIDDLHACPAIHMRASDRRLIVAYTKHNIAYMRARISTNVADSTAWGAEINLAATLNANNLTYPNLIELSGDAAGTIRLIFRNWNGTNWSWRESVSTNDGASWPAATSIWTASPATRQAYLWITSNAVDTIHFVGTENSPIPLGTEVDLGHMYRDAATGIYYKSDGTSIGTGQRSYSDMTVAHDGYSPWVWDFGLDGSGFPIFAHTDGISAVDHRYNLTRWDGAAWGSVEIASGWDSVPNGITAGGFAFNHADPDQLYVSAQQPSGRYEMEHWISADGGATFPTKNALTSGSSVNQILPVSVRDAAPEMRAYWLSGVFNNTTFDDFDFALIGARDV